MTSPIHRRQLRDAGLQRPALAARGARRDRRAARRAPVRDHRRRRRQPRRIAADPRRGRAQPDASRSSTARAAASPPPSTRACAKRAIRSSARSIRTSSWRRDGSRTCSRRSRIPAVAAAQGHYRTAPDAGFWARMMGRDLEQRYRRIRGDEVDHVCTGNTAYRASALHQVGLLDETLGYGSDNDLSYRLTAAGHRLVFCRDAVSLHRWREDVAGYVRQQYGVGYGRLDLLARHPHRVGGDDVSGALMMAHGPLTFVAMAGLVVAARRRARGSAVARSRRSSRSACSCCSSRTHAGRALPHGGDRATDRRSLSARRTSCATPPGPRRSSSGRVRYLRARRVVARQQHAAACRTRRNRAAVPWLPPPHRMLALVPAFNEALNLAARRPRASPRRTGSRHPRRQRRIDGRHDGPACRPWASTG